MNKCRQFLDGDKRFEWATSLSDHWLNLASRMTVRNQEEMSAYNFLCDHSDELLYSASREKARLDGVKSW